MNERVVSELERTFGRESVTLSRARFDGPDLPVLAPRTSEGFAEALRLAHREGWTIVPTGLGSKLSWTRAPRKAEFMLSTWAFAGVIAYEPGDGTLTARAGSTMAELATRVASGGHTLTPDVQRPRQATLGGVIAAAQSGSDRLRYGSVREHVLGLGVLLGDGTSAKSGGRLVKNVTGYDLHRLFAGSHGSLCLILEASLRLFPLPEEDCLIRIAAADRAQMLHGARTILDADARPISFTAVRADPLQPAFEWSLSVRLGGRREVVAAERAILAQKLPACVVLEGSQARGEVEALRDRNFGEIDGPLLRVEVRPAAFGIALELLEELLRTPDARASFRPRWWCEPGLARIDVALRPLAHDPELLARSVTTLRAALSGLGGRVRLFHAASDVALDPFGDPPQGIELMHAIRERLDPARVFASGRFL